MGGTTRVGLSPNYHSRLSGPWKSSKGQWFSVTQGFYRRARWGPGGSPLRRHKAPRRPRAHTYTHVHVAHTYSAHVYVYKLLRLCAIELRYKLCLFSGPATGEGCLVTDIIAADIQKVKPSKLHTNKTPIRLWRRQLKLMGQFHFKRGRLLAQRDLSRIKSAVYSSQSRMETLAINMYTSPPWVNFIPITRS